LHEAKLFRRLARHVDLAARSKRSAIIDANDNGSAILKIGHARYHRHVQRRMRGGHLVLIENLAIRRHFSVELRPVPRGDAGRIILLVLGGIIPDAVDLIGIANLVVAPALRERRGGGFWSL